MKKENHFEKLEPVNYASQDYNIRQKHTYHTASSS